MNCMKCGRETPAEQVFCEDCLLNMEKYPVKPGTAVHLPRRREVSVLRKPVKRRTVNSEDQVRTLKKRVQHLTIALILSLLVICALLYPSIAYLVETRYAPGQNYNTIVTPTVPSETAAETLTPSA